MLNGIDVSSNQPDDICAMVDYDFAIVKATGNPPGYAWDYRNEYMEKQAADVLKRGKLLGFYHFTYGLEDAKREAALFADAVKPYIGKALLAVDYEGPAVDNAGRRWLVDLCREVKRITGVNPLVYASSSVIASQGLSALADEENIGLWSANYWAGSKTIFGYSYEANGLVNDCPEAAIWQYTGNGILPGYSGYLDLDVAYMDAEGWKAYATGGKGDIIAPSDTERPDPGKLADAVIRGEYGTGRERRERLGDDYGAVQAIVDIRLGYVPFSEDIEQAADMVIAGRYSNGLERAALLGEAYGYIQQVVDRRYGL